MNEETAQLNNKILALGGLQTFFLVVFPPTMGIANNKNVVCCVASLYSYILDPLLYKAVDNNLML